MRVIFLRHAEAEQAGPDGTDFSRRLTPEGRRQARASAKGIVKLGDRPAIVLTSPLPRALETAEIAAKVFGAPAAEMLDALSTNFDAAGLTRRLARLVREGAECVCLVGHNPNMEGYAGMLIGVSGGGGLVLGKSGSACVELTRPPGKGAGILQWLMKRNALAMLAGGK